MGHDGSVTILEGDQIVVHHQLERFNGLKNQFYPTVNLFDKIKNLNINFDKVIITSMSTGKYIPMVYYLKKYLNIDASKVIEVFQNEHHLFHAECARHFFNYPKNAVYFISDGDGGHKVLQNNDNQFINGAGGSECESIYDEEVKPIFKYYNTNRHINLISDTISVSKNLSLGKAYQKLVLELGLGLNEEGKAMALSSHGKFDNDIANRLVFNGNWNLNLMSNIDESYDNRNKFNRFMLNPDDNHTARDSKSLDFAKTFQIVFQLLFLQKVKKINKKYELLVLSGGCAQNVLNNSFLKDELNKDILADPFNGDFGISLGAALHYTNVKVKPLKHICSGFEVNNDWSKFKYKKTNTSEVAKILLKEPVAIFSGKSEQGQRGLGFRSLLANPLLENCNELVNKIKKREWYRPFACTILHEEAHRYFEIEKDEESPYMMFVYKNKNPKLTNVCSVDGWSRIQTLKKNFHPKFYQLIKAFQKISFIPAVLNTSLNLPGEVLCEDSNDLYKLMKTSKLKYAYISDEDKLVWLE